MANNLLRPETELEYICENQNVGLKDILSAFDVFKCTESSCNPTTDSAEKTRQITELLIHDKDNRFGPSFDSASIHRVKSIIEEKTRDQKPIKLVVMWGGLKHYVPDADQGVDLAELCALLQFARLQHRISMIYPPGLDITFFLEDFGVWYEDAYNFCDRTRYSVEKNIDTYVTQFSALLKCLGEWGHVRTFFDLLPRSYSKNHVIEMADLHRQHLFTYWNDLEVAPEGTCYEDLESYKHLQTFGWAGTIPATMRAHYLKRMCRLYPDETNAQHIDRVIRYFSIVLLYQRVRILHNIDPTALKVSLYKPAPGILDERTNGRIHMRTLPARVTSSLMPPWTCKGCIAMTREGRIKLSIQSFFLAREQKRRFQRGILKIKTSQGTVNLSADLMLSDTIEGGDHLILHQDLRMAFAQGHQVQIHH